MNVKTVHKHQVDRWYTHPYNECVNPTDCALPAHGGMTDTIFCSCGALQKVNVNRGYRERGPWEEMNATEEQ
jgi:hypothetical protein